MSDENKEKGEQPPEKRKEKPAPLVEVSATRESAPPVKPPIDPYIKNNLWPIWKERGLRVCDECGHCIIPQTGLCSAGGDQHPKQEPYDPKGNVKTISYGHG